MSFPPSLMSFPRTRESILFPSLCHSPHLLCHSRESGNPSLLKVKCVPPLIFFPKKEGLLIESWGTFFFCITTSPYVIPTILTVIPTPSSVIPAKAGIYPSVIARSEATWQSRLKIKCVPFDSKYFSKKEGFFISNTVYK